MAKKLFAQTEDAPQTQYGGQGTRDLTGSILQTGQAAARGVAAIGGAMAEFGNVYDEHRRGEEKIEWNYALQETNNAYSAAVRRIDAAKTEAEAAEVAKNFLEDLTVYPGAENSAGLKNLQSGMLRKKFLEEYTPLVKLQMADVMDAKRVSIREINRKVKYESGVKGVLDSVVTREDVRKSQERLKPYVEGYYPVKSQGAILSELFLQAADKSIRTQAKNMVELEPYSYTGTQFKRDALLGEIEEYKSWGMSQERQDQLKVLVNQSFDRAKVEAKARFDADTEDIIGRAETPLDVEEGKEKLRPIVEGYVSPELQKTVLNEMYLSAADNSIRTQTRNFVADPNFTLAEAEAWAETLKGQILDYDFPNAQADELRAYVNDGLRRAKVREKGRLKAKDDAKERQHEAELDSIYGDYYAMRKEPGRVDHIAPGTYEKIENSSLTNKEKYREIKLLEEAKQFRLQPSDPKALLEMENLYGIVDATTKELDDKLNELIDAGRVNVDDGIEWRNKNRKRLTSEQHTKMQKFIESNLNEPLLTQEEITVGDDVDITYTDMQKKREKYQLHKAQLQFFLRETFEAYPDISVPDLQKIYEQEITNLVNEKGAITYQEALLQWKKTADREEYERREIEKKGRREGRIVRAEATFAGWSSDRLKAAQQKSREQRHTQKWRREILLTPTETEE